MADTQTFAPTGPTVDPQVIQDLRDLQGPGEPDILQELVAIFAQDTPPRLAALQQAMSRKDATELRKVAHSLKGSSGNLGASRLAAACAHIEELARANTLDVAAQQVVAYVVDEFARVREELKTLGVTL